MKNIIFLVMLFLLPFCSEASETPTNNEVSLDIGNAHPFLNSGLKVDGYDYLEATVDVQNEGASVSWAPFLNGNYTDILSETRFQLSQKDDVTSLGFSMKFNPLNPRSSFRPPLDTNLSDPTGIINAKQARVEALEDNLVAIFTRNSNQHCSVDSSALTNTVDTIKKAPIQARNIGTSVFKCMAVRLKSKIDVIEQNIHNIVDNEKKKAAQKELSNFKNAYGTIFKALEARYWESLGNSEDLNRVPAINSEIALLKSQIAAEQANYSSSTFRSYKEALHSSALPVVTISYVSSYFKVLGGDDVDSDNNGKIDNAYNNKSTAWSLAVDWRLTEDHALALLYSRSNEREKAEAGTPKVKYQGIGATWIYKLMTLNESGYKTTADYKDSLFEPSINLGIAYEERECKSVNTDCVNGVLESRSITPFVDFKISKAAQFRIGVPFKKDKNYLLDNDTSSIEVLASINFQLGKPK
ncbi:MAG: hypothetical protein CBB67_009145 [Alteromonadaceae bacterium TMED7]|uniref:hypothetical protein n=1 Tax=Alteromonas sp. TaxID=232 RepID=UPI000B640FE7|nr:hypothetical protein [Alteromonas sp.]MAI36771.1 hypothetical protein [Alteromonas sp.]RPH19431.1 MAG: hypothetical protein CBB67_009145 [Alteromonadaceae bacterium TMED7]